jgi:hypothetical protein
VFVRNVSRWFELDGGVLQVEVPGQAALQLVQQFRQMSVAEASVVHHHVSSEHGQVAGD